MLSHAKPIYNITKSVASLIHNFHDRLYESKHIITLPGTVIRYMLREKIIGSTTQVKAQIKTS